MPLEVGRFVTIFETEIKSEQQMLDEMRAGRFHAGRRLEPGVFEPLGEKVSP
jgi:hypothetical protein